jgi:glycosyltransferase involved in cell wall biosynthesis
VIDRDAAAGGTRMLHVSKVSGISGSENHLLLLLPQLRERGWDVRFALLHEDEPGARELAERLERRGVPVDPIRLPFAGDPRALTRLVRLVRRHRPAILHTHLVHADFHALPAGRLARVPVLASTKHGFNPFRASRAFALADRSVARLADLQIAISRGLAEYLAETEGFDRDAFEVVHYGIEPGPEPAPPPEEPRLLAVGRLIAIKGFDVLLRAFAEARRELPALTLEIAGEGPLEGELRAAAPDGVTFLGRVSPVGPLLERAAIVVVPSRGEGFGMVALEAAERGRPVVASSVGGLPEIVANGETGLVVPPDDAAALARAIVTLAADPARTRTLGAAARGRALADFAQERCTDRIEELYRASLARAST